MECEPRGAPGLGRESAAEMTADAVPTRRAFAEERQAEPDCGSLVRFSRRASCIHWALGERWRLAPTIAKLTFREGLSAGGRRIRTTGPSRVECLCFD